MKQIFILSLTLLLLFGSAACTPINHMLGNQADNRVGAMYFNGTVLKGPVVVSEPGESLVIHIEGIGSLKKKVEGDAAPQLVTIVCKGDDEELMKRCLKAKPGNQFKSNGPLVQTGVMTINADYFALK